MRVLGLDPGIARMGYGVLEASRNLVTGCQFGCITTSKTISQPDRLALIRGELVRLIKRTKPDIIAVEKLFFQKNVKTALVVGEARGVALATAAEAGVPIREFTPLEVKQAVTGYGRAEKGQVQRMLKILLELKTIPKQDDAADALAVAYTAWLTERSRI